MFGLADLVDLAVGIEREFLVEGLERDGANLGILDGPDQTADAEHAHPYPQPRQRLTEFQADYAGAEDDDGFGQFGPLEEIVAGDQSRAGVLQKRQHVGPRTGGDHDTPGAQGEIITYAQRVLIQEACLAHDPVLLGNFCNTFEHPADETVAVAPNAVHHRLAVDPHRPGVDAETLGMTTRVGDFGGRNQQFARHAANPGTGGAELFGFNQHHLVGMFAGLAIGHHAGGSATDYGDIDFAFLHVNRSL